MTAGQWGQFFVVWIVIGFVAAPFLGRWLRKRRDKRTSAERAARLAHLLKLADEYDYAESATERQAIYRKAQSLGLEPRYAMPVRVITGREQKALSQEQSEFNARRLTPAERQKAIECGFVEEDEPFHLDEPNQPRPAA